MPTPADDERVVAELFREGFTPRTERFASARDLWATLDPTLERWTGTRERTCGWIFRGQGDSAWRLTPSAWRDTGRYAQVLAQVRTRIAAEHPGTTFDAWRIQELAERALLGEFIRVAAREGHDLPPDVIDTRGFGPDSNHEVAALAQHYRLPTGLLDFTRDPYVALYWAVESNDVPAELDLAVWAIQFAHVRPSADPLEHPRFRNRNLLAQDGLVLRMRTADHFRRVRPRFPGLEEVRALPETAIVKMVVSRQQAPELRRLLEIRGMTRARLTPGLYGVTETVLARYDA